ncbi:hypothetical protein MJO28_007768 [Puccinia striiformis f. sp. tritici]|uniref:Uncharacterized protein n=2 Tax=Puccinia striiformis TaxID=27350 RepID=A0A2S4UBZ2_9BASI|nr:hypothetical protein Pst134EB_014829 [Puccinia striiformis f. sp. tritici]KAI7952084.1 hypothetical protein MJO28_007768 [Puccinia striiformis f. sp. tritici]POV94818.1 hypothetical protein PSTT_16636 [Puccinia striiformis]
MARRKLVSDTMVPAGAHSAVVDRRCFSSWLNPVFSESSYESLWSATREIHSISSNRSSPSSTGLDSEPDDADEIDPWERSFGLNWLTRLLSFTIRRISTVTDDDHDWESLSSLVGQVMAQMTGSPDCPAQSFLRRYHFEMSLQENKPGKPDDQIDIQIREGSLSFSAIGSQTWNSAPLLCRRLGREPFKFFPQLRSSTVDHSLADPAPASTNLTRRRRSLKVLELGSGTGLVGLTASQILASILSSLSSMEAIDVEIILTDYHPEVLENLQHNLELNQSRHNLPEGCLSTLVVKALKLDWREPENSELARTGLAGAFDVVLGSDLVYEPEHAVWASEAVRYFLKSEAKNDESLSDAQTTGLGLPRGDPQPSFHLLLPLRPTFTKESEAVHRVFGGSDMNLLLDQTDQIPSTLPIHCCKWELSSTNDHVEKALQPSNSRPFKIIEYSKEEGVQFGQGCGEYQYLQITWAD